MNNELKKFEEQTKEIEKTELNELPNQDLEIIGGSWFGRLFKSLWLMIPGVNPQKYARKLENKQTKIDKQTEKLKNQINELIEKEYNQTKLELKELQLIRKELKLKEGFIKNQETNFFKKIITNIKNNRLKKKINKEMIKLNKQIKIIEQKIELLKNTKNKLIEFKKNKINLEQINEIEGDLLLLVRQSKIEIYNDIKTGIFEIDENRQVLIDPSKRKTLRIAGKDIGVFIGSENSFNLYDQDPIHDSYLNTQHLRQIIISLEAYKNIRKGNKSLENIMKYVMYIVLGGMAIYGVLLLMGVNIFEKTSTEDIKSQAIDLCWTKTDENQWIYTCVIPGENTAIDQNTINDANTDNKVYLGNGFWMINGVEMYIPDNNINFR